MPAVMSARASCAITRDLPLAKSCSTRAAVSRPRESAQYIVLPSLVKPSGMVVCASSSMTVTDGVAATLLSVIVW